MITVDTTNFNRRMALFTEKLGIEAATVVKKEAGELMKTLVHVSPPADPAASRQKIDNSIHSKFEAASDYSNQHQWKTNYGGVMWYRADSKFLYGTARPKDATEYDTEMLYNLSLNLRPSGRQSLPFFHKKGSQRVLLSQRVVTKASSINKLVTKVKTHLGRLKAAWLTGSDVVGMNGSNMPPQWVMKHKSGARGRYINELDKKDFPSFTIGNSAAGVGTARFFLQRALDIRSKAMLNNFRLFFKGKKELSQYA